MTSVCCTSRPSFHKNPIHAPEQGAEIFFSLERKYDHYADSGDLIYVWDGLTYQFSQAWLDFRRLWDRQGADCLSRTERL
ncbi:hypothetical protein L7E84_004699 [Salmonella enterica]|nr:hypothetical protein [Salmonella enterica]